MLSFACPVFIGQFHFTDSMATYFRNTSPAPVCPPSGREQTFIPLQLCRLWDASPEHGIVQFLKQLRRIFSPPLLLGPRQRCLCHAGSLAGSLPGGSLRSLWAYEGRNFVLRVR